MKIAFIGKFSKLHDEEYIARSFEFLGHEVFRIDQHTSPYDVGAAISKLVPDLLLYTKWDCPASLKGTIDTLRRNGMRTVCWLFDLYWDYPRENQIMARSFFRSDYVFTTDGGHQDRWKQAGVNHQCVRQGIYSAECYALPVKEYEYDVAFVGSDSPLYVERTAIMNMVKQNFPRFGWFGRTNTDELRGKELNELYSKCKVVIGDSYPSQYYWSNRVVETLGRGGFLIHRDVPGLKQEYPDLVTYNGTPEDLRRKIEYFVTHDKERLEIVRKNLEHVKNNYTMEKKCAELISKL